MKAAVYLGPGHLEIRDVPIPPVGENEVLIKVAYCGICGTDVHIYHGDGGAANVNPPLIIGHEFSGIVEKVGRNVTKLKIGDKVSVNPNDMCGECYFCHNGMEHFCEHFTGIGTTVNGGFAEYCVASERTVYKTETLDMLQASMVEPLSCCVHGIDLCGIKPGDTVLIMGTGPIGLIMLQLAKLAGAGMVIATARSEKKSELAKSMGADRVINVSTEDLEAEIAALCRNLNCVIECVGNPGTIEQAISVAGKGATVMLFGLTGPDAKIEIKPDMIFKKELRITSSFINPYTYSRSINLLNTAKIDVTSMIKNIIPLEKLEDALSTDTLRKQGKVVVKL